MHRRAISLIIRCARFTSQSNVLPQSLLTVSGSQKPQLSYISNKATTGTNDTQNMVPLLEKEVCQVNKATHNPENTFGMKMMASKKIKEQLADMFNDIHKELDAGILSDLGLTQLVKYVLV